MDNFFRSPNSTPPNSPITSPITSPSPISSPNLSSESKQILNFLVSCADQDRLITENLIEKKKKIELENIENVNKKLDSLKNMTLSEENVIQNKIIKVNKKKKKKNRCHACYKKLPLIPIICKCGFKFCCSHRHPEDHQCTFDHKKEQKNLLRDKNPQIISNKIVKI